MGPGVNSVCHSCGFSLLKSPAADQKQCRRCSCDHVGSGCVLTPGGAWAPARGQQHLYRWRTGDTHGTCRDYQVHSVHTMKLSSPASLVKFLAKDSIKRSGEHSFFLHLIAARLRRVTRGSSKGETAESLVRAATAAAPPHMAPALELIRTGFHRRGRLPASGKHESLNWFQ